MNLNDELPTRKQATMRWLVAELIEYYLTADDWTTTHEYLQILHGFDRVVVLEGLFWYALDHIEWKMAEHCIDEGFVLNPGEGDFSGNGPLFVAISQLGDRPESSSG